VITTVLPDERVDPFDVGAGQAQHSDRFDVAVASLCCAERVARERGSCCAHRVVGVGPTGPASALTVRSIDLDDQDPHGLERAGQSDPVAAGAFDTDHHHRTQRPEPLDEFAIARRSRRERRRSEQTTALIEHRGDVHIEVRVDSTSDCIPMFVSSLCVNQ
jgi:hypothetical protein